MANSNFNTTTTLAQMKAVDETVAWTNEAYKRAQALYEAEPTRAHDDNLRETLSEYKWAIKTRNRMMSQLNEDDAAVYVMPSLEF